MSNSWARNPTSWLSIVLFLGAVFTLYRSFPRVTMGIFVGLALWITVREARARRLGFRVVSTGRDSFKYEETADGEIRGIPIYGELMWRSPRIIWIRVAAKWDRVMPAWASGRREEIFTRIRAELDARQVEAQYVETQDSPITL
jgi:hypothetical protein